MTSTCFQGTALAPSRMTGCPKLLVGHEGWQSATNTGLRTCSGARGVAVGHKHRVTHAGRAGEHRLVEPLQAFQLGWLVVGGEGGGRPQNKHRVAKWQAG
eukprot:1158939-Pelagomonas_calceolata.AAC.6